MPNPNSIFFDHRRHKLRVHGFDTTFDVLAFHVEEKLNQPFHFVVELTCVEQDIAAEQMLNQEARFSLHAAPRTPTFLTWDTPIKPLRTLHGIFPVEWSVEQRFQFCYAAMIDATEAGLLLAPQHEAFIRERLCNA